MEYSGNPIMGEAQEARKGLSKSGLEELATDKNSSSCSGIELRGV